jgi:prepilin-type N-terminal cleavage/methylation domain-containing protein
MRMQQTRSQSGFSLIELMVAMAIMLLISGAAVGALLRMTSAQATIWNRTQMHSGIRGATEVLQQEVGQAGRISLPVVVTLTSGTAACTTPNCTTTITVSDTTGMFIDEKIVIDIGAAQETVLITLITATTAPAGTLTIKSANGDGVREHTITGVPVQALGAFSAGIIPPAQSPMPYVPAGPTMTYTDGSTGNVLKMFGDINADGKMVYVEYECIIPASPSTAPGNLYRRVMRWDDPGPTVRPPSASQILLSNIMRNPDNTPCFTYQLQGVNMNGVMTYFVTDVAITLTVQTQNRDPVTKQFQNETKALLNVAPRNVFNAWQLASLKIYDRVQPIPASVTLLLH